MTTNKVTLALPSKGAIAEPTLNFLRECGLKVDKPNQRQYIGYLPAVPDMQVLFQRVTDILYKVADGTAQLGITGLDIVREYPDENLIVIHDRLGYGQCSLVIAIPETWVDVDSMIDLLDIALEFREQKGRNIRIATKYPTLTRQFLHNHGLHHFTLVKAEGAIEAAPTLGYADLIVDLTQTGTTLRENHLKILPDGIILESQACLIGNRSVIQNILDVRDTIRIFLEYIDAAMQGRNFYQIIANIRGNSAEEVAHRIAQNPLTRGLQGPTIAPIYSSNGTTEADGFWYTATVIINGKDLLDAVHHFRTIGGTQTIVTPVRYVFMEMSPSFAQMMKLLQLPD